MVFFDGCALFALAAQAANQVASAPPNVLHRLLGSDLIKAWLPLPVLVLVMPALWLIFRGTWHQLDHEAHIQRERSLAQGKWNPRAAVACLIIAVVLTMQEYYGGSRTYGAHIGPILEKLEKQSLAGIVNTAKYGSLYGHAWWALTRLLGYVVFPLTVWKLLFRKDSILDMGFRVKGILRHWWIYTAALLVVLGAMLLVARQPDFGTYYPFYKLSSRSWYDFVLWEVMYCMQFVALEIFFRGWMLAAFRPSMGSAAIFAMAVPYCMIHYGKPYLEAHGAIVAGVFLGSLAMKTRSIYVGVLVHVTVAVSMDLLALWHRGQLPTKFFVP